VSCQSDGKKTPVGVKKLSNPVTTPRELNISYEQHDAKHRRRPKPDEQKTVHVSVLSARVQRLRQRVGGLAERGYFENRLLGEGIGAGSALVLALALYALGARGGRLVIMAPFFVVVAFTAIFWGGRPANVAAITSVIVIDYFFLGAPGVFSVPNQRDVLLLIGILALAFALGTVSDRRREARREARALAHSEQLQRTLLRVISHDLKTPLTTIIGSLQMLLDTRLNLAEETRRELATIAYDQANRLNRLVAGILEMTRLEAGTTSVKDALCDVADVVDEALGQLQETLQGRRCVIRLPSSLPAVQGDVVLLSHALANLLHNAAKFSPDGTPIEVTADPQDRSVVISVADHGQGIPAGELDRVFEKFYRLRQSRDEDSGVGTGLGLAVAKGIVEAHRGRIWAERRESGGTIVRMSLPLA
jgi:K+-sensing histidine kinase KdpD